jgi:hypothetical protein
MRRPGAVLISAFALFFLGCGGGYIGSARTAYQDGRYLEVAENLGKHEHEVRTLSPDGQADYGLYRGLSLMMIGDHAEAGRWLDLAATIEEKQPGTLRPEERRELFEARGKLAKKGTEEAP